MNLSFVRFPFLPLTMALIMGIVSQHFLNLQLIYQLIVYSALLILAIIFGVWKSEGKRTLILFILLFCLIGSIRFSIWKTNELKQDYVQNLPFQNITLSGIIKSVQPANRPKAVLNLTEIKRATLIAKAVGKILIYFPYEFSNDISPGQTLSIMDATLEPLPKPRNPGQFNYGKYLQWRGIVAQCRVENENQIILKHIAPKFSLENNIFAPIRSILIEKLETHFSTFSSNFLKALLLGQRESLDKEVIEDFQNAGVMHVLAISGLHVGFIALIFYAVLSFFPLYFKHRNFLLIFLLLFYMFLTGCQPSVVRATLMAVFLLIAMNLERPVSIYNSIFAAAFTILIFQPQQLFWVGFQFSFLAVLSMIYFYDKLKDFRLRLIQNIRNIRIKSFMDKGILIPFLVSFSAQIGTLPFTMHYFHKLSIISFLLNILVIPFIGFIVALGFIFLVVAFLIPAFASMFANFLEALISLLMGSVQAAAHIPAAFFYIPRFSILNILLYLSILVLLFNLKNSRVRKAGFAVTIFLTLIVTFKWVSESHQFNLVIMDVGQGDAAFLLTPQNKTILVDTGPASAQSSSAQNAILPVMNYFNVNHVDRLFISHTHLDHMGGTFELLKYVKIDSVYLPAMKQPYGWNDSLLSVLSNKSIPIRILKMGDEVVIDDETRAYVLGPFPPFSNFSNASGRNLNNDSVVLLIKYREHTLLFPGDAEKEAENYLVLWKDLLRTDFLKVGHHGSNTSTTDDFLNLTKPQYASISVGAHNRFGHPSESVINKLIAHKIKIFRTDKDRAIWFQMLNGNLEQVDWN